MASVQLSPTSFHRSYIEPVLLLNKKTGGITSRQPSSPMRAAGSGAVRTCSKAWAGKVPCTILRADSRDSAKPCALCGCASVLPTQLPVGLSTRLLNVNRVQNDPGTRLELELFSPLCPQWNNVMAAGPLYRQERADPDVKNYSGEEIKLHYFPHHLSCSGRVGKNEERGIAPRWEPALVGAAGAGRPDQQHPHHSWTLLKSLTKA